MADRIRAQVIKTLNEEMGRKLEKKMSGKVSLAARKPLVYTTAGAQDDAHTLPSSIQIGDLVYSRDLLLRHLGIKPTQKAKPKDGPDDHVIGYLRSKPSSGALSADQPVEPEEKQAAEARSVDTAARAMGLNASAAMRRQLNLGKKKPTGLRPAQDAETVKQIKKEALETLFVAGLLHAARDPAVISMFDTPVKLAAFLGGLGKVADGGGLSSMPTITAPAQGITPKRNPTKLTPSRLRGGPAVLTSTRPAATTPVSTQPRSLADFVNALRTKGPALEDPMSMQELTHALHEASIPMGFRGHLVTETGRVPVSPIDPDTAEARASARRLLVATHNLISDTKGREAAKAFLAKARPSRPSAAEPVAESGTPSATLAALVRRLLG